MIEAINEQYLSAYGFQDRFSDDATLVADDSVYDVFLASKIGKPKDDYPNFDMKMQVKSSNVKDNRFAVLFTDRDLYQI